MLAAHFEGCQSGRSVLESASFQPHPAAAISCTFGLSPKFSTPVEKTVENRVKWRVGCNLEAKRAPLFASSRDEMNLWDEILARIETKVNRHSFYTWFRPTTFVAEDQASVTVRVPNALFKDWLTKHYATVITEATAELRRPQLVVTFIAEPQGDVATIPPGAEEVATLESGSASSAQPGTAGLNPRYTFDTF